MTIEIGPNLLALLQLVVPSVLALAAAYYARTASVQSAKVNGQVAHLMKKEATRSRLEDPQKPHVSAHQQGD